MRVLCSVDDVELHVSKDALSRSNLLAEMHSCDPEGCAKVRCDSRTWKAWLADDAANIRDVKMVLAVLEVRLWHNLLQRCC
jgi:hypothetical protein